MTLPHTTVLKELEADSAWLVHVSRRLLMRTDEAEDVVQEASLLALKGARSGQGQVEQERARPWLVQTVRRLSWNANRRERTRAADELDEGTLPGGLDPAGAVERAEFRSALAALVVELPASERQAIILRYYEGLSTSKIVEATAAPSQEAVRQRIARGIAKLRRQLDEDAGPRDWRQCAIALSAGAGKSATKVAANAKLTSPAAALLLGAAGAITGAFVLLSQSAAELNESTVAAAPDANVPRGQENTEPEALTGEAKERSTLDEGATVAAELEEVKAELVVRMVDEQTGEPVADQAWFVIRTGEYDYGRAWGFATKEPNPSPIAEGVTGPDGEVRMTLPDDPLLNLCTDRSERYARGSWPIRSRDGAAEPTSFTLSKGTTFRGRVVDDAGEPIAGMGLATHSFTDKWVPLAVTGSDGRFALERCADFPRSFMIREDDSVEATRTLPTEVGLMPSRWVGKGPLNLYRGKHLELKAGAESVVELADTVVPRPGIIQGTVRTPNGVPIVGALVSSSSGRAYAVQRGSSTSALSLALPWNQPAFELGENDALTDEAGRFLLAASSPRRGKDEIELVAFSPGGALDLQSIPAIAPGQVHKDVGFVLDDTGTVHLHLVPVTSDGSPTESMLDESLAGTIQWDLPKDPSAQITTLELDVIGAPGNGAWEVLLPAKHLPDRSQWRSQWGSALAGTLFAEGFRAARVEFDPADREARVELTPLPKAYLKLDVHGSGAHWLESATVKLSPMPPAERLTNEENERRGSHRSVIQARGYGWKNGEIIALDVPVGSAVYAYVKLFGGTARAPRTLPPIGPISLKDLTAEAPHVVKATIEEWPERERRDRAAAGDDDASVAVVARRPTTIKARVTDAKTGEFLAQAAAVSVNAEHRHHGGQRVFKDNEIELQLKASVDQLTLRFACTGYESQVVGPLALPPGETIELGVVALEPLRSITCRLVRPDGGPVSGVHDLTWSDATAGWTRVQTSEDGTAELFIVDDLPERIRVKARQGSNDPDQLLRPVLGPVVGPETGASECVLVVPEWRKVRLRVEGLAVPWCYGLERIVVTGEEHEPGTDPIRSVVWWPRSDGEGMVFDTRIPPGRWTLTSADPEYITFPARTFEVEAGDPAETLEVRVTAELGPRVPQ